MKRAGFGCCVVLTTTWLLNNILNNILFLLNNPVVLVIEWIPSFNDDDCDDDLEEERRNVKDPIHMTEPDNLEAVKQVVVKEQSDVTVACSKQLIFTADGHCRLYSQKKKMALGIRGTKSEPGQCHNGTKKHYLVHRYCCSTP